MVKGGKVACSLICKKMTELELYRPEASLIWSGVWWKKNLRFTIEKFTMYDWYTNSFAQHFDIFKR